MLVDIGFRRDIYKEVVLKGYNPPVPSLHVLFASTSGHTEYVIDILIAALKATKPDLEIEKQAVDLAKPEDLLRGDVVLLACGTWNTGGIEGQLNTHMYEYLRVRAKDVDLAGKKTAIIALGDQRYFYTSRAGEHLRQFVREHGGKLLLDPLIVVNEPFGQEAHVQKWADKLLTALSSAPA